jgi:hypothetical protein
MNKPFVTFREKGGGRFVLSTGVAAPDERAVGVRWGTGAAAGVTPGLAMNGAWSPCTPSLERGPPPMVPGDKACFSESGSSGSGWLIQYQATQQVRNVT